MTIQPDKAKRWRPRFSVRTLAIVVTLVCAYFATWNPTAHLGVSDVMDGMPPPDLLDVPFEVEGHSPLPLVVRMDFTFYKAAHIRSRYYFWFFGFVAKLPYEREIEPDFSVLRSELT